MDTHLVWAWIWAHRVVLGSIIVWLIANVAPRPNPSDVEPRWQRIFWAIIDRLSVLTAEGVPGRVKWLLAPSPPSMRPPRMPSGPPSGPPGLSGPPSSPPTDDTDWGT